MGIIRQARTGTAPSAPAEPHGISSPAPAPSLLQRATGWLAGLKQAMPPRREWAIALAVGVAYYAGAELAFWIGTLSYFFAPLWPPNMILFCALLRAPYRTWWLYIAAALPAHVAAEMQMGMQALPLLGAFLCNAALALGAAAGLRRLSDGPPWLDTLAKAWSFILVAVLGAPALVAGAIATAGLLSGGEVGGVGFALRWGLANLLGGIALAPILVTWMGEGMAWMRQIPPRRALEAACLTAALAATAYVGFPPSSAVYPVLACLPIPLMLWGAVRFGPRGASGAIFVVALMVLAGAIEGRAPFASPSPEHTVLSLQMFIAVLSAPFLVLAAIVEEGQQATLKATLAQKELQAILDNTPACVYVKDLQGHYIFANRSARALLPRELVGRTADGLVPSAMAAHWSTEDKALIGGGEPIIKEEEVNRGSGSRLYLTNKFALRDRGGAAYAICVVSNDITDLKLAQTEVHDLSTRLLGAQDQERRRIARELHDGTVQSLTAITLNLSRLLRVNTLDEKTRAITNESLAFANEMQLELRTLSYLLHPPLLDEVGLAPALAWYVDGFTKRSGIEVKVQVPREIGRAGADIEMALFRIVQESLSNVHRHAKSKSAEIRLERTPRDLVLTISDTGRGMTGEAADGAGDHIRSLGVGIAGMKARLKQLGGRLDIRSGPGGTTVTAVVPHAAKDAASPG